MSDSVVDPGFWKPAGWNARQVNTTPMRNMDQELAASRDAAWVAASVNMQAIADQHLDPADRAVAGWGRGGASPEPAGVSRADLERAIAMAQREVDCASPTDPDRLALMMQIRSARNQLARMQEGRS